MKQENRNVSEALSDNVIPLGNSLRQKAEEIIKNKQAINAINPAFKGFGKSEAEQSRSEFVETPNRNDGDALKLLNETEVYQIELKMQNEELKLALHDTATATALYDLAPVGYFTIDRNGTICQLNLGGANMLGKERLSLVNSNFKQFVTIDTLPGFHHFLLKVFETSLKQTCEVRLIIDGNPSIHVHLQGIISEDIQKCLVTGMDVTELKLTEEALRKGEERHRLLADNASDIIWTMDLEGRYTYVSPSVEKLRGYTVDEVMHQSMMDVLTPESAAIAQARLNMAFDEVRSGEPIPAFNSELEQLCKDGSTVWTDVTSSAMFNKEGEFIGILGVSRDISHRKRVEEALRESKEKHRIILDESSDPIFTFNPDGQYRYVNQAFADGVGIKREKIIGKKIWDVFSKDEADKRFAAVKWVFENGEEKVIEVRVPFPDGDRWYITTVKPILNVMGQVITVICISKNITERKRAEEKIRESEEIFTQFMEYSPIYIFFKDENIRSLRLSRNYEKMIGKQMDELLGKTMDELFPSDLAKCMVENDLDILKNGVKIEIEEELNGRIYSTIKFPIKIEGKPSCLAGFTVDITERHKAEAALKQSEARLGELNATKDKFFFIIAHDLKSPFNAILGFSNLLVEQIRDKEYKKIEKSGMIIQKSSQRAMDLLMNLLEWVRSQTGKMDFSPEKIEIAALILQITKLLHLSAKQKKITIYTELPESAFFIADRPMIATILRNLITNAIKFTNLRGNIVISVEQKPNELMITVADDGIGIRKEALKKLFRIDESYSIMGTQNEKGTGLGLILCKEFVDRHGGKIWAESDPDVHGELKGSKFCFTIPNIVS